MLQEIMVFNGQDMHINSVFLMLWMKRYSYIIFDSFAKVEKLKSQKWLFNCIIAYIIKITSQKIKLFE